MLFPSFFVCCSAGLAARSQIRFLTRSFRSSGSILERYFLAVGAQMIVRRTDPLACPLVEGALLARDPQYGCRRVLEIPQSRQCDACVPFVFVFIRREA